MLYNFHPHMGHCGLSSCVPKYHHLPCCEPSSTIVNINIPPCPSPESEPEPEPLNLDALTVGVDKNGEMRDSSSGELTGLKLKDCMEIISSSEHDLKISKSGKLEGKCEEDKCQECVDAINSSIIELKKGDRGEKEDVSQETAYFTYEQMPVDDNIAIIF